MPIIKSFLFGTSAVAAMIAAATACAAADPPSPKQAFRDVTPSHVPQDGELHALDSVMVDVDRDGDLDVVLAVEGAVNRLYLNDGTGRLSEKRGVFGTLAHDTEHVRAADFNRDGLIDVVFVAEDDEMHQLYFGDGKGGFADMSARLPGRSQGNGLAVGDVNGDGLADIVIGNTSEGKGEGSRARNFLWLNDVARPGHFIDATVSHLPDSDDQSQGLALVDIDKDADLDLLVASQSTRNRLLLNDGTGRFTDASDRLELKVALHTREVHAFDANGDGHVDILYFNLTSNAGAWDKDPQTRLLINDGQGRFTDDTTARLPAHRFSSWGGTILDFNHDGAPDIIVSAIEVPGFKPLQLRAWQNDGRGRFNDVTADVIPASVVGRNWSLSTGDLDGDRLPDVFVGQWGTQARLLLTSPAPAKGEP